MVRIREEAKNDLANFENSVMNEILDKIEEYLQEEVENEKIEVIRRPSYNAVFHRLKLTENELNHRIYFDYRDSKIYVFAVRHREFAYSNEELKESVERLQKLHQE